MAITIVAVNCVRYGEHINLLLNCVKIVKIIDKESKKRYNILVKFV